MRIGIKTFDNQSELKKLEHKCDFLEIMAITNKDYSFLKEFTKEIVIHAEHQVFGTNPADIKKLERNIKSVNFARNLADEYNSKKIIYHPGRIDKNSGYTSIKISIDFLNSINEPRILLENLTSHRGNYLCAEPKQMKYLMDKTSLGFCLDLNHAIETAIYLKKDYIDFIKEFIKLKPSHYHLGGQTIKNKIKSHLPLKDSEIDLKQLIDLLPLEASITLETDPDINKISQDLDLINKLIKYKNC